MDKYNFLKYFLLLTLFVFLSACQEHSNSESINHNIPDV